MKRNPLPWILSIYWLSCAITILQFDGVGDTGDSVMHYLYAKYAFEDPSLLLNHWAKPLFVLLSAPFAQAGFVGMKVFNSLVGGLTLLFTYRTAERLGMPRPWLGALLFAFAPLQYTLTFSGLTEPLFALLLVIGIFLVLSPGYSSTAAVVVSFMPFVRSEGLLIIAVFALYFLLVRRDMKNLLLLLTGHVVYSIAGSFHYRDPLWVWTKIPYARLSSSYGSGDLFHFADQLPYVTGIPICLLLIIGLLMQLTSLFRNPGANTGRWLLVSGSFFIYFIAHSVFWYMGIFNSMGLKRVMLGVMPVMALLALEGTNTLVGLGSAKKWVPRFSLVLISALVVIFPFIGNHASVQWNTEMRAGHQQMAAEKAGQYVLSIATADNIKAVYVAPWLSEVMDVPHFDPGRHRDPTPGALADLAPGELVIWDNWFCPVEFGLTAEVLQADPRLEHLTTIHASDKKGSSEYRVYRIR